MKKKLSIAIVFMIIGTSVFGFDSIDVVGTYNISAETIKKIDFYMKKKINKALPRPHEGKLFNKYSKSSGARSTVDDGVDDIYKESVGMAREEINKIVSSFKKCRMIFKKNNRALIKAISISTGAEYVEQGIYSVTRDVLVIEWKRSSEKFRILNRGGQIIKMSKWTYPFPLVFVRRAK